MQLNRLVFWPVAMLICGAAWAAENDVGRQTTFVRGAYEFGSVLPTNRFVEGENKTGEPIDTFHMMRLEFGWQTAGDQDWHHIYNFPAYGLGLSSGDYFNEEELGKPTSIYGFFSWPFKRWGRRSLNLELGFGLADNWVAFDEVNNPYNVAIGAGRSAYIDVGAVYEMPLDDRWWLQLGFAGTHYSNGGSQQPNWGINQLGALAYVKYDFQDRRLPEMRREIAPLDKFWETAVTFAGGVRNLSKDKRDDPEIQRYLNKDYAVFNLNFTRTLLVSHISAWDYGMDLAYDGSVGDLEKVNAIENDRVAEAISFFDHTSLGFYGGYEHVVYRARLILQVGYTALRKDVPGQVPRFYQRLGLKHHVLENVFAGVNVRFNDFSRANNLEFNVGYKF